MTLCRIYPFYQFAAMAGGTAIGVYFGSLGWGFLAGFVLGNGPLLVIAVIALWWAPADRPVCPCGECGSMEYHYIEERPLDTDNPNRWEFVYDCSCGRRFVTESESEVFSELLPAGERKSYMKISQNRWWSRPRWKPVDSKS